MIRRSALALAWLLATLLVCAGLLVHALRATLLDRGTYTAALERSGAYEAAPAILGRYVAERAPVPPELAGAVAELVRQGVEADWVRAQADSLLDGLLAYLRGEEDALRLPVDSAALRERAQPLVDSLLPPPLAAEVRAGLRSLPERWDVAQFLTEEDMGRLAALRAAVGISALVPGPAAAVALLLALWGWAAGDRRLGVWLARWPGGCLAAAGAVLYLAAVIGPVPAAFPPAVPGGADVGEPLGTAARLVLEQAAAAVRDAARLAVASGAILLGAGWALAAIAARLGTGSPNGTKD